jgi:hypothetical protein
MFLYLPIAILATLSPITVSDTVPRFDIAKECRFEGGYTSDIDRCSRDEATALNQLKSEWGQFAGTDKSSCTAEATTGDTSSYVELLTCLEIAGDLKNEENRPRDPTVGTETPPTHPGQSGVTVGVKHDSIRFSRGHH